MSNSTQPTDAWLAAIREIIRQELRRRADFAGIFQYKVQATNQVLQTIDALPVSQTRGLPPIQNYPLRTGVPGGSGAPAVGSRLAIAFLDQDPSQPVVIGAFTSDGALNLTFNTGNGTVEHITTIEGVCAMLVQLGTATAGLGGGWTEVQLDAAIAAASAGILPTTVGAIKLALASKGQNLSGTQPSVGCPNLNGG